MNKEYLEMVLRIIDEGKHSSPRGMGVTEIFNVNFFLEEPMNNICTVKPFHTRKKYAEAEFQWYVSGSNKIADMGEFAYLWEQFSDDGIHVNSAYGHYIFPKFSIPPVYYENIGTQFSSVSQWDWIKNKLTEDKDSRQAIININQPMHKAYTNPGGTRDFPCCVCMLFDIRDGRLNMTSVFRSQDVNTGLRNDVYTMTKLQEKMALELNIELGWFCNFAHNMHLYDKDRAQAEEFIKNYYEKQSR